MTVATPINTPAPGTSVPVPITQPSPKQGIIPFRRASLWKQQIEDQFMWPAMTAGLQRYAHTLQGTGYMAYLDLELVGVTALNAAAVAFTADSIWAALNSIVLNAVGPDIVNLDGVKLHWLNMYGGNGTLNPAGSADPLIFNAVAGGGATGGSFRARWRLPIAINERNLVGLLGNQDRATKYTLRTDLGVLTDIYTVSPTFPPVVTLTVTMGFYTVPSPTNDRGRQQAQMPPGYGVVHNMYTHLADARPQSASTVNHFIQGLGNVYRLMILEYRDSSGARSDLMLPTSIAWKVGADTVFQETSSQRRQLMFDRYGFDAPAGVLVYDWIRDFGGRSGFELGDDYVDTANVSNAEFQASYPVFALSPGNLNIIADTLYVPDYIDLTQVVY